ncbi:MAG TPA: ATP-dependent helicase [Kofleriaceae bacterium]|nr:ATP-dependent helicase [Kofleriaceae bacterium]
MSVAHLDRLNEAQRQAVLHEGAGALLIVAGAGSGKTNTLAHRVAHLVAAGADARRILLLTFTRRAAAEMTRRAQRIAGTAADLRWSGTFHAIANRLLRLHHRAVTLDPSFTVLDRSDSADLMNFLRGELGLAARAKRFPQKGTCLAIYSRVVNAREPLARALADSFPWCAGWEEELRGLFRAYVAAKQERQVLDYDDLLLYWFHLMAEPQLAAEVGARFDHVLVDEYQDTNALQAGILRAMKPDGAGVTVVGDDAQSIYSFRAATVRNILDFPGQFTRPASVVTLAENYRSTQPILDAANAVIGLAAERHAKELTSRRPSHQRPILATVDDEMVEVDYVIERILEQREAGVALKRQAVLFRTAHHSDALEVELGRRNIPFVKFGGLKFLEAAHVKDLLCILRWAENAADSIAAFRVLQLLPGVGPASAGRALEHVRGAGGRVTALAGFEPPAAAREVWPRFCETMARLADPATAWGGQLHLVRDLYDPLLEQLYDAAHARAGDLSQLEQIAAEYPSRERFLTELTLDPPDATGDHAGPPLLDEDYLILSTIHSAKGQEWDVVYLLHVADGCIPSDMSTGKPEQIEEERRLLYVAMTRARDELHLVHPMRMFIRQQQRHGDRHVYTPLTRFIPDSIADRFERRARARAAAHDGPTGRANAQVDVAARLRDMW